MDGSLLPFPTLGARQSSFVWNGPINQSMPRYSFSRREICVVVGSCSLGANEKPEKDAAQSQDKTTGALHGALRSSGYCRALYPITVVGREAMVYTCSTVCMIMIIQEICGDVCPEKNQFDNVSSLTPCGLSPCKRPPGCCDLGTHGGWDLRKRRTGR